MQIKIKKKSFSILSFDLDIFQQNFPSILFLSVHHTRSLKTWRSFRRNACTVYPRQTVPSRTDLPSPSSSTFLGPALILPRDENPRCPPTDTNGYLCQRRNLLLYIPLYKQRVNRARALALRRVRAGSPHASRAQAIGLRAVETDLSIVPRAFLLLLLLLLLLPPCKRLDVCSDGKLEYTPAPVPFTHRFWPFEQRFQLFFALFLVISFFQPLEAGTKQHRDDGPLECEQSFGEFVTLVY